MLQKFLLIGVGGSGGKTLRYIWRELDRRLRRAQWDEQMPIAWQFLHIDVPQIADVIEGDVPADVGDSFRYLGLAEAPQEYAYYDRKLISRPETLPAVAGWRPDPTLDYTSPYLGAGQRRAVGRVITLAQLEEIKKAVLDSITALSSIEADQQLRGLGQRLGADPNKQWADPAAAIVVSSMGGGSGSGAFLDVIDVLRTNAAQGAQWVDRSLITVLYAADVFSDLPPSAREGIEPNTLAALAELLAASEHEDLVSDVEQNLVAPGAGSAKIKGRRNGRHTFIIGNRNGAVALETSRDVFRSVGKTLATFMVDDIVQHELKSYLDTNTYGTPCTPGFPLADSGHCASFGYASIGLGRNLFAEYSTERLAKRSLERLLRGYREGIGDAHLRSDKSMIDQKVTAATEDFFERSGLWELGSDHNQVLDALRDVRQIKQMLDGVVEDVRGFFRRGGNEQRAQVAQSIRAQFTERGRDFQRQADDELATATGAWATRIQHQVLDAAAETLGQYGLDVTIGLLVALNEQVLEAASELRRDRDRLVADGQSVSASFDQLFTRFKEKIGWQHPDVDTALGHQRKLIQRRHAAGVCSTAAQLLDQVSAGVLENLQQALRNLRDSLARQERNPEFAPKIRQWATGAVPSHLRAAPNELLLDRQENAPERLAELLNGLVDGAGADAGESLAVREIIARAWPSQMRDVAADPSQGLIVNRTTWVPSDAGGRDGHAASRVVATYQIQMTPGTLERDARRWVFDRRGGVSGYVGQTLGQWLSPVRPGAAEAAETFAGEFELAVRMGAPLISVNKDVHDAVHGTLPPAPMTVVSEIPIGLDHAAAKRCLAALIAAGLDEGAARQLFNENSDAREIELTSFTGRYVHPIVFDSLTGPIAGQWRQCSSQPLRNDFWGFRRSRSLTSFVPLAQSRQRSLVRGWLVAEVLGYVPRLDGAWSEQPFTLWSPRGRRTFPRWLLGRDVTDHGSILPALLESLPLALIDYAGNEGDDLGAYARLIALGSSPGGIGDGTRANAELEHWVKKGQPFPEQPDFEPAPQPRIGTTDDTPEQRINALKTVFTAYEQAYRTGVGGQAVTPETTLTLGRAWEAHQLISGAALELIRSTHAISVRETGQTETPEIPVPRV